MKISAILLYEFKSVDVYPILLISFRYFINISGAISSIFIFYLIFECFILLRIYLSFKNLITSHVSIAHFTKFIEVICLCFFC